MVLQIIIRYDMICLLKHLLNIIFQNEMELFKEIEIDYINDSVIRGTKNMLIPFT